MFQFKKYLFRLSVIFGMAFQMSFAREYSKFSAFRKSFAKIYHDLGCEAPLCSEMKYQNVSTYSADDRNGKAFQVPMTTKTEGTDLKAFDNTSNGHNHSCCSPCSCSDSCLRYGNCCPDKLKEEFVTSSDYPLGGIFDCVSSTVKQKDELLANKIKMITKCRKSFNDSHIVQKCNNPQSDHLDDYRIVSDKTTNETYRNIHCARCNYLKERDIVTWLTKVKCLQGTFFPRDMSEIVTELRKFENCDIEFVSPAEIRRNVCKSSISECNKSLSWKDDGHILEEGCKAFDWEFRSGNETYKNAFCYLCNVDNGPAKEHNCDVRHGYLISQPPEPELNVRFSALLDFTGSAHTTKASDCEMGYLFDSYKGVCRKIICPPLTVLTHGFCKRVFHSFTGLMFEATIKLTAQEAVTRDDNEEQLEIYFRKLAKNFTLNAEIQNAYDGNVFHERTENGTVFYISMRFTNDINFADKLIELNDDVISLPRTEDLLDNSDDNETFNVNCTIISGETYTFLTQLISPDYETLSENGTIIVSKFYKCEMIELNLTEFMLERKYEGLFLKGMNLYLTNNDYIETGPDIIRICADDYIPLTRAFASNKMSTLPSIINTLSIVCSCLSVVCLAITIIIYSIFSELKTQPGFNNMFLSISMLMAFLGLFLGGIHSLRGFWCSLVGLLVHFLWLNSIFWLNVCCFHMFKTFVTIRVPVHKKSPWLYHVYCLVSSTILVNVNIIWSLSISQGQDIGYGKHSSICYIIYPHIVGYTMTLPVVLTVVSNSIMYIAVICKITKDSFNASSRRHFSIYIKLSTITGISWLSYIPAFVLRSYVCEIIFSVLVACQGIYIMCAFVCNTRVLNLCRRFIKDRKEFSNNVTKATSNGGTQDQAIIVTNGNGTASTVV